VTLRGLQRTVRYWQERFGLTNWSIAVVRRPGAVLPEGHNGSVSYHRHELTAAMQLPGERSPQGVEYTVCHELAHLALMELDGIFDASRPGAKLQALWEDAEERLCNSVARACVGHIGMPWPESAEELLPKEDHAE